MFQKKEIIYHGSLGVCRVEELPKLTDKHGDTIAYYGLKSLREGKTAYIPIENHSVLLRELISFKEAKEKKQSVYKDLSVNEKYEIDYVIKLMED